MARLKLFNRAAALKQGRFVFVYSNVRTKQVIYSLRRTLEDQDIKQLSFFGKKTVPPSFRRDMWEPLLTVVFPRGREREGLIVYQRLREYRKFRDVNWTKRQDLRDEHAAFRKEALPADEYGYVEPIWRARQRILMDQKADAIADVSAILERQKAIEARIVQEKDEKEARESERLALKQQKLKEAAAAGRLQIVESNIRNLEKALERGRTKGQSKGPQTEEKKQRWEREIRRRIGRLAYEKGELRRAVNPVAPRAEQTEESKLRADLASVKQLLRDVAPLIAKGPPREYTEPQERRNWRKRTMDLLQDAQSEAYVLKRQLKQKFGVKVTKDTTKEPTMEPTEDNAQTKESSWSISSLWNRKQDLDEKYEKDDKNSKKAENDEHAGKKGSKYQDELDVIRIQWLDLRDAHYARSWPAGVVHDVMGRTHTERFKAPRPYLSTKPGLSKKEQKHMEENVQLDGEANEEGAEDNEEVPSETEDNKSEESTTEKEPAQESDTKDKDEISQSQGSKENPLIWDRGGKTTGSDSARM